MPVGCDDMRGESGDCPAAGIVTVTASRRQAVRSFEILVSSSP